MTVDWPAATLGPVARARVLAAALPGAGYAETTFDLPYREAWDRLMDLERSVPDADRLVRSVRVRRRRSLPDGAEQLWLTSRSPGGLPLPLVARVEDGWCLMRGAGRLFVVVMAAEPVPGDPRRTRYAHVEAVPRRWARPLRPVFERTVTDDIEGFRRHLGG